MKAIGIDIGTTTVCGVVMDIENRKVLEAKTLQNDGFLISEPCRAATSSRRCFFNRVETKSNRAETDYLCAIRNNLGEIPYFFSSGNWWYLVVLGQNFSTKLPPNTIKYHYLPLSYFFEKQFFGN